MRQKITIDYLRKVQIPQVIGIYLKELPCGLFSLLGEQFLRSYLKNTLAKRHSFTLVAATANEVIGFATCIVQPGQMTVDLLKKHLFSLVKPVLYYLVTNPVSIWDSLILLTHRNSKPVFPLLKSFAVRRACQRQGVGTMIIKAVKDEFRKQGMGQFIVGTRTNLKPANAFYQKTGGQQIDSMTLSNRILVYYRYET